MSKLGAKTCLMLKLGVKVALCRNQGQKIAGCRYQGKKLLGVDIKDNFFSSILVVFLSSYFIHIKQSRIVMNRQILVDLNMLYKIVQMSFACFLIRKREKLDFSLRYYSRYNSVQVSKLGTKNGLLSKLGKVLLITTIGVHDRRPLISQ